MRTELLQKTVDVLEEYHFDMLLYMHSCLDIAAQKKSLLMLIKVLENIDGFRKEHADELKRLSSYLNSYPILIGKTTKVERMKDDTIYDRHGISSITIKTFENSLEGAYPDKVYSRGRMIASIDGSVLGDLRKKKNMTLGGLAKEVKLTKESIYLYEHERMRVKYEIAKRIEQFLHATIITPKSPFVAQNTPESRPKTAVEKKLFLFDFEVYPFHRMGFDIGAKDKKDRLIVSETPMGNMSNAVNFSNFFKTFLAVVSDKKCGDVPVIEKEEFMSVSSKRDLVRLIKERSAADN